MNETSRTLPAVGVDLGGTKVETALVDDAGRILASNRQPTHAEKGPDAIRRAVCDAVKACLARSSQRPSGVGVGIAGQVDGDTGEVYAAPNLGWHNVPLMAELEAELSLPVYVTNDVRAAAWGEWKYGAGRGVNDLVCVFVGTGIGGGIVSGGKMMEGCSNTAGELGHMVIVHDGRKCTCPGSGCLEAYAGGWSIAERAKEAVRADAVAGASLVSAAGGIENITAKVVGGTSQKGDPLARRLMDETAAYLGSGITGVVNAFNPRLIILGGGVIEGSPELVQAVENHVRPRALKAAASKLKFVKAALGNDAGVVGAAAMAQHMSGGGPSR